MDTSDPQLSPKPPDGDPPRIYVASLSDYNAGRLHGRWIIAAQDIEAVWAEVNSMLDASREPNAEEWAIHDYDNFGPVRLSEYERLDRVVQIAHGIAEHGEPYAYWATTVTGDDSLSPERFADAYVGTYESLTDYAEQFVDGLGSDSDPSEWAPPFLAAFVRIDWDGLAEALTTDCIVERGPSGVHIFES